MFTVFGDTTTELHATSGFSAAKAWVLGYIRTGDWGGYRTIDIRDASGHSVFLLEQDETADA